jgi:hypothetical protein
MEAYRVEGNAFKPEVTLDKENGVFAFGGRAIPENAMETFEPILNWWSEYLQKPNEQTVIDIKFDYINSSSMKQLAKLFVMLDAVNGKTSAVSLVWHHNNDDTDSKTQAERLSKMVNFPIKIVADNK